MPGRNVHQDLVINRQSFGFGGGGAVLSPVAEFTADVVSGYAPLTVNFTDLSTNAPTSWSWNFGDGSPVSVVQNPTHIFATPGVYSVTLTATNAGGSDIETKVGYITAIWTPVFATTGGGVLPHMWFYAGQSQKWQDSGKTIPATADGDPIGAMTNQGSDVFDIIQAVLAQKPTLKLNIRNGQAVLRYDGGDWLRGTFSGGNLSQPITYFITLQLGSGLSNDNVTYVANASAVGGSPNNTFGKRGDTVPDVWYINNAIAVNGNAADENWDIFTTLANGASSQSWENGVSQLTGNAGADASTGLTLGATNGSSAKWVGDIAEILAYGANLSDADKIQVQGYLATKFNVVVGDYST